MLSVREFGAAKKYFVAEEFWLAIPPPIVAKSGRKGAGNFLEFFQGQFEQQVNFFVLLIWSYLKIFPSQTSKK